VEDRRVSRVTRSGDAITVSLDDQTAESAADAMFEALRPETRRVVVVLAGGKIDDDEVFDVLLRVEEALADDGCFLELRDADGVGPVGEASVGPEDLAVIDGHLEGSRDRDQLAASALDALIELVEPDMGTVQRYDESDGTLRLDAQFGFQEPFLSFFDRVGADDADAGAVAMAAGDLLVVDDVGSSPDLADAEVRSVMEEAGVRAVASMPFFAPGGQPAGAISMHHRRTGARPRRELLLLRLLAGRLGTRSG
jgi:hypothetical protein